MTLKKSLEAMRRGSIPGILGSDVHGVHLMTLDLEGTRIALGWALSQLVRLNPKIAAPRKGKVQ